MRVYAAPDNLPYSSEREEGFENRIAEMVAQELWRAGRGFTPLRAKCWKC